MKHRPKLPTIARLCHSAKGVLDDHLLNSTTLDDSESARQRKLEELFAEIKRQLESLELDPAPAAATVTEG